MVKGSKGDIAYLRLKLMIYLHEEEYEKAEVMKKWIIELGGNPEIENINSLLFQIKNSIFK